MAGSDHLARPRVPHAVIIAVAVAFICVTSLRFWMLTSRSLALLNVYKPVLAVLQPILLVALCRAAAKNGATLARPALHTMMIVLALATYASGVRALHAHFDSPRWRAAGLDSDIDDEFIVAAGNVRRLRSPYADQLYSGNPISEGPAWVILNAPFGSREVFFLLAPAHAVLFATLAWRRSRTTLVPLVALALSLASFGVWESAFGGDLAAAGFAMASASMLSNRATSPTLFVCGAVLAGAAATVRLPFLAFPLLHGVLLWRAQSHAAGALAAAIGMTVAAGSHAAFWGMASGTYPPLHLMTQSRGLIGLELIAAVCGLTAAMGLWIARSRLIDLADVLACQSLALFVPFSLVAAASSWHNGITGEDWTRYIVPAVPSISAAAALSCVRRSMRAGARE